jgi:hypothetical protein
MAAVRWLICKNCGVPFREDDPCAVSYADHPYNWSAVNGFCLACWLVYPDPPGVRERAEFMRFENN